MHKNKLIEKLRFLVICNLFGYLIDEIFSAVCEVHVSLVSLEIALFDCNFMFEIHSCHLMNKLFIEFNDLSVMRFNKC